MTEDWKKAVRILISDAGFSLTVSESLVFDYLADAESSEEFCLSIEDLIRDLVKLRDGVKKLG